MKDRVQETKESNHSSRTGKLLALAAASTAIALAITLLSHQASREDPAAEPHAAKSFVRSDQGHARGQVAPLSYHWQTGDLLTFTVRSHSAIRIEEEGWSTGGPGNSIEISGLCSYRVLEVDDDRVLLAAQMSETTVRGDQQNQAVLEELLDGEAVMLLLNMRGQRIDCLLSPDLATEDRQILSGLYEHQLVLPEEPRAETWITTETGRAGTFQCAHSVTTNGVIEKRRTPQAGGQRAGCEILRSDITAKIGATWLEILDARETFAIHNGAARIGSVETTFQMRPAPRLVEPVGIARLAADRALAATFTSATAAGAEGTSALERQSFETLEERLAAVPLEKVVDDLRSITATAEAHEGTVAAIHALRDWLLVHPEGAFPLVDALADPSLPAAFTARAIHALELAGRRPEAQQALADILQRPEEFSRQAILQAVIAAGGVGGLRPELHAALSATINRAVGIGDFSVSDAALYALGNLAQTNPQVAEQLSEALLPDLAASNHARTTQTALNALANGRLATPELVAQATALAQSHPGPAVRAAAVHYLSRLPETTPAHLIPFLRDFSEQVQLEAIESLALRKSEHPTVTVPLEEHLASATSDLITVRLQEILEK